MRTDDRQSPVLGENYEEQQLTPAERRRRAVEHALRDTPRLRRETREHLRRARRLIDGLPPDW